MIKSEDKQNKTNNEQLREFIETNVEESRHNTQVLDDELQALETEEEKEVDLLGRIATKLDPPTSVADMIKDMGEFDTQEAKEQYIEENFALFTSLPMNNINQILSELNRSVLAF